MHDEAGPDREHQAERDLRDDQAFAEMTTCGGASPMVLPARSPPATSTRAARSAGTSPNSTADSVVISDGEQRHADIDGDVLQPRQIASARAPSTRDAGARD